MKRCIVEAVAPKGYAVLNAADPLVAEMASRCPGGVVFFARSADYPVFARHRGAGGRAAFVQDGQIVVAEGAREEVVISVDRIPLTHGGQIGFQVENSLAADCCGLDAGDALGNDPQPGRIDRGRHR